MSAAHLVAAAATSRALPVAVSATSVACSVAASSPTVAASHAPHTEEPAPCTLEKELKANVGM